MVKAKFETIYPIVIDFIGPDLIKAGYDHEKFSLQVYAGSIIRVLTIIRDHPKCKFEQLVDIVAVDWLGRNPRFEVIYHLLSHHYGMRIQISVLIDLDQPIPSIVNIFTAANWYEREIWDLFGIPFGEHPDLRRLLTDYNFAGHPLRKDFPISGYSEVYYDSTAETVTYRPLNLTQPYRKFDFLSPWETKWSNLIKQENESYL